MRVLVTGAGGQLGREVVAAFAPGDDPLGEPQLHEVVACDRSVLDITDRDEVLQVITSTEPDCIVHAAAWTDVDGCELDPEKALLVNAMGTRHVATAARMVGARVCYVSTDYVFDGQAKKPYTEWDTPRPLSSYGRSKLGGESELEATDTIVRTSWVCGIHGKNFVKTVLDRASRGLELKVVKDQFGCFTLASDLAETIKQLVIERRSGIFHVTNQGPTSWYRIACEVLNAAGLDLTPVRPISTSQLRPPRPAPRPAYSVLDNAALRLAGLPLPPEYPDALVRLVVGLGHTPAARTRRQRPEPVEMEDPASDDGEVGAGSDDPSESKAAAEETAS